MNAHPPARVLLAEDEEHLGNILRAFLAGRGYEVTMVRDGRAALDAMQHERFDVALLDIVMPELDGLEVLRRARELPLPPQVIVTTGNGSAEKAAGARELGAYDYLPKPYRLAEVEVIVRRACEKGRLLRENQALRVQLAGRDPDEYLPSAYAPLRAVLAVVERAARGDAWATIAGEPGSGRRHLARQLHRWSRRAHGPLLTVNCDDPMASQCLFGAAGAAGAVQLAATGTLILSNAEALATDAQRELAALAGKSGRADLDIPPRVVATVAAASNDAPLLEPLPELAELLGDVTVCLPPLRERMVDIWPLACHFLKRPAGGGSEQSFTPESRELLERYDWPGNVDELRAVAKAAAYRGGMTIGPAELSLPLVRAPGVTGIRGIAGMASPGGRAVG